MDNILLLIIGICALLLAILVSYRLDALEARIFATEETLETALAEIAALKVRLEVLEKIAHEPPWWLDDNMKGVK